MAAHFLIALGAALASATFILLVLRFVLKAIKPDAFSEVIPAATREVALGVFRTHDNAIRATPRRQLTLDSALGSGQVAMQVARVVVAAGAVHPVQSKAPSLGEMRDESPQREQAESSNLVGLPRHSQAAGA